MKAIDDIDIGARLRAGDPLLDEPSLSPADVDAMRRATISAAASEWESPSWFPPLLAIAATAAALTIAVVGVRSRPVRSPTSGTEAARAIQAPGAGATEGRRQLQFATRGGTRVIWVFDPEFNP